MTDPDKPLHETAQEILAEQFPQPEPMLGRAHDDPPPETDAAAQLRAFEDTHLGEDAVRIGEQVERGHGSAYARLHPARHRHYEALEKLVASEQKLADAHAALIQADTDHEAAMADVARCEQEADQAEVEPDAAPAA